MVFLCTFRTHFQVGNCSSILFRFLGFFWPNPTGVSVGVVAGVMDKIYNDEYAYLFVSQLLDVF